ncbi:hypothetical protein J3R82DRAFT_1451 [Butyriboletus roseoflavus]|nr:hypothetical protein J3R82DRAFT_1451 [Butyriboletus roseoflavus]
MSSSPTSHTPSSVSPLTSLRIHQCIPAPSSTIDQGPFVFGYAFSFVLMGVLSAQCCEQIALRNQLDLDTEKKTVCYFRKFPDDRVGTKILVALILFLESLITIFALHGFWASVIVRGSDLSAIVGTGIGGQYLSSTPIWSFVAIAILTGLVSSITHAFCCWRIWIVGQSLVVPVFVMMVSLIQCAMVSYGAVKYGLVPDLTAKHPMPFYVPLWLSSSLVCDLAITTSMTSIVRSPFYAQGAFNSHLTFSSSEEDRNARLSGRY